MAQILLQMRLCQTSLSWLLKSWVESYSTDGRSSWLTRSCRATQPSTSRPVTLRLAKALLRIFTWNREITRYRSGALQTWRRFLTTSVHLSPSRNNISKTAICRSPPKSPTSHTTEAPLHTILRRWANCLWPHRRLCWGCYWTRSRASYTAEQRIRPIWLQFSPTIPIIVWRAIIPMTYSTMLRSWRWLPGII